MAQLHQRCVAVGGRGRGGYGGVGVAFLLLAEEGLYAVGACLALLHLRYGGGEVLGGGNHQHEEHHVADEEVGGEAVVAAKHQVGAKQQYADHDGVA